MPITTNVQPDTIIADIGSGEDGGIIPIWTKNMIPRGCTIDAFDLNIEPGSFEIDGTICNHFKEDVEYLYHHDDLKGKYDMVVADNIFEHVENAHMFSMTLNHVLKKDGLIHIAIPVASNITDIMYRLLHPNDGGTHFQRFERDSFVEMFSAYGFELEQAEILPDNWSWLEEEYNVRELLHTHR